MKELKEENLEIIKEISLLFMLVEKAIDYEKRINKAIEMIKLSLIQENKRLNDIITDFEQWLQEHSMVDFNCKDTIVHEQLALSTANEYLQELKENK